MEIVKKTLYFLTIKTPILSVVIVVSTFLAFYYVSTNIEVEESKKAEGSICILRNKDEGIVKVKQDISRKKATFTYSIDSIEYKFPLIKKEKGAENEHELYFLLDANVYKKIKMMNISKVNGELKYNVSLIDKLLD